MLDFLKAYDLGYEALLHLWSPPQRNKCTPSENVFVVAGRWALSLSQIDLFMAIMCDECIKLE